MTYDVSSFLASCVDEYVACSGSRPLVPAAVPYLGDTEGEGPLTQAQRGGFHPADRRPPVDYAECLKASGLPVGRLDLEDMQPELETDAREEIYPTDGASDEVLGELQ